MTNPRSFLAILDSSGHGKVIPVGFGQVPSIVAAERSAGSVIVGEYSAYTLPSVPCGSPNVGGSGWRKDRHMRRRRDAFLDDRITERSIALFRQAKEMLRQGYTFDSSRYAAGAIGDICKRGQNRTSNAHGSQPCA